jgi:hypothetical protein
MDLKEISSNCQIPSLQLVADGIVTNPEESFSRRLKLTIRRHLSPEKERAFKNYTNNSVNRLYRLTGRSSKPAVTASRTPAVHLVEGDFVRVRPREEIENTLNHWRQVRGCAFMPEMAEYCGTIQRVFRSMIRFVDERDLKIKKSKGIILLEGVMCKGTEEFGRCDRSCLHFWREEWLERLDEEQPIPASSISPSQRVTGEFVKVLPMEAIEATLDQKRRLGGCTFLPEMADYCGTRQQILKSMNRFVDERDLRVKGSKGIVLLQGVMCKGTSESVNCGRSCHLLWREEWLEKNVEPSTAESDV